MKECFVVIDVAKFTFCVFIVMLHTHLADHLSFAWIFNNLLFRLAVPFFFVASGYFFGRKIKKAEKTDHDILKKYIKRLLLPYVFWLIINVILESIKLSMSGKTMLQIILFAGHSTLVYPVGALWYVYASIIGILIIYFLHRVLNIRMSCIAMLAVVCYCFALITNSYYWILAETPIQNFIDKYLILFTSGRNGLFVGFPFLFLGYVMAFCHINTFSNVSNNIKTICLLLFVFAFSLFEAYCLKDKVTKDEHSLYISFLLLIPLLFIFFKNMKANINTKIAKKIRMLSVGIYFSHRAIFSFELIVLAFFQTTVSPVLSFILVLICSFILCIVSYHKNGFLAKFLY